MLETRVWRDTFDHHWNSTIFGKTSIFPHNQHWSWRTRLCHISKGASGPVTLPLSQRLTASPSSVHTAQGGRGHGSPVSPLALSWPYKKRSLSVSEGLMASPGPLWVIPNEKTVVPLIMLPSAYSLMVAGWESTHSLVMWSKWQAHMTPKITWFWHFSISSAIQFSLWKTYSIFYLKFDRTRKGQFSFQCQRNAMPKDVQTTAQLHSSHTLGK